MTENVYVAVCLDVLPSYAAGIDHERTCPLCKRLIALQEAERRVKVPADWFEDSGNIAALLRWLRDSDEGIDLDSAIELVEKPWKWNAEYRRLLAERIVRETT